jgi:hypothetical protein
LGDLAVELDDDAHRGTGSHGERGGDRRGSGELLGAQRRRDLLSTGVDVALAPAVFEGRTDLRQAQMRGGGGSGSAAQNSHGIAVG